MTTAPGDPRAAASALQGRVDLLVDRAPALTDLFFHRLGAAAAVQRRARGHTLDGALAEEAEFAAMVLAATPIVLERALKACDGPALLLKGPEITFRYPEPLMRPYHDLDLLVADAPATQRALLEAGFEVVWERPSPHHELPVALPQLPLVVEVHNAPKWVDGTPPATGDLFARARPSRWAEGTLALPAAEHAVIVAAHAWTERPLRRVMDLFDVAVLLAEADREDAARVAGEWGVRRMWDSTVRALDALVEDAPMPLSLRTWARSTPAVREPSRTEALLARIAAPFWALPAAPATSASATALLGGLRRAHGSGHTGPRAALEHPALNSAAVEARGAQYSSSVPRRRP